MAKMGRPKADNPRTRNVGLRLTPEQYEELYAYSKKYGQTVTKTLLQGFAILLEREEKKNS